MRLQIAKDSGCAPGILRRGGCPSHLVTSLLSLGLSRYPKGTSSILPDGRIPGRMGKAGARGVAGRISFYISEGAGKAREARPSK